MSNGPQMNGFVSLGLHDTVVRDAIMTLSGLASDEARRSAAFEAAAVSELVPQDFHVYVKLRTAGTGATSSDKVCFLYVMTQPGDNAAITSWPDGGDGQDGATTVTQPTNLVPLGVVNMPQRGVTYQAGPFSIAAACGGRLPARMSVVLRNRTGAALSSTADENALVVSSHRVGIVNSDWYMAGMAGFSPTTGTFEVLDTSGNLITVSDSVMLASFDLNVDVGDSLDTSASLVDVTDTVTQTNP